MSRNTASTTSNSVRRQRGRAVWAASAGNFLELYDMMVYAYSAVIISQKFFPVGGATGLLSTFAVFAVGFFARPLGTLFFGFLGDKHGRKPALILSVALMALGTFAIGCLPAYESIGIFAPILLVIVRLVQGFALAGEWTGSAAMLVEYAPSHRRGFIGSFNQVSTALGFFGAACAVTLNNSIFTESQILDWAWRLPFLLGILTGIVALVLRFGLDDTPAYQEAERVEKTPLRTAFTTQWRAILLGFGFTVGWTVAYYFYLTYLPTYLTTVLDIDDTVARWSNLTSLLILAGAIAVVGHLSDKIGRKPLLLLGTGGFTVFSIPLLITIGTGNLVALFVCQVLIALILAAFSGPGPAALCELFPTSVRYSALGIGYNFSTVLFGGTAPFIATAIASSPTPSATVAILPTATALVSFVVVLRMSETFRSDLA